MNDSIDPASGTHFAAGGGEVGALMRAHDWAHSPLGPMDGWPQALKTLFAVMNVAVQPMFIVWGPQRTLLYNTAYISVLAGKHPAVGQDFLDVWEEIRADLTGLVDRAYSGDPIHMDRLPLLMHRKGFPEETYWAFSYTPVRDEAGAVDGFLCACREVTDQVIGERRRAFRLDLEQRLHAAPTARAALDAAAETLGGVLGAMRCTFTAVTDGIRGAMAGGWPRSSGSGDDGAPCIAACGADRGLDHLIDLASGIPLMIGDVTIDPRTAGTDAVTAYAACGCRASLDVPILRGGVVCAVLTIGMPGPMTWTDGETTLVREIAERAWQAAEHVQSATARLQSESRLRAYVTASSTTLFRMSADWARMLVLDGKGVLPDTAAPDENWLRTYIHPEDRGAVTQAAQAAVAGRAVFDLEHRVKLVGGGFGWMRSRAVPVFADDGAVTEWFGAASDVTERKTAETAIAAEAEALARLQSVSSRLVADDTPDAIYGCILDAAMELMGAEFASIQLLDAERGTLVLLARRGFHPDAATSWSSMDAAAGAERDTPEARVIVPDVEADATHTRDLVELRYSGIRAYQTTPLVSRTGRPIGRISTHWRQAHTPSPRDLRLFDVLARQAADAIERVEAQAALRESAARLRFTLKAGRLGEWSLDWAAGELTTSETCRTNFGRDPAAPFTYADLNQAIHPDDQARMRDAVALSFATRQDYDIEYRVVTPAGIRWVAIRAQPAFGADGTPLAMAGVSLDVTERKRAELELLEFNEALERRVAKALAERELLATIVETTGVQVQALDTDFRWLAINVACADAYQGMYGRRPQVGEALPDLLHDMPEQLLALMALWSRALAGEAFTQVGEFGDPGIGRRSFEMRFEALRDETGRQVGAFLTSRDVTERLREQARLVQAEEALRQSQKMEAMGQLTGGVAHDFNNLLTPIVASLDLLQRRGVGGQREQRLIAGAAQSAERAKVLVQRLLAFARRQPLQTVAVDIARLVHGMGELVASTTGPQIEVLVQADENLPSAKADPNQLEMALLNLSVNARDAMAEGGTLRITASAETVAAGHRARVRPGAYIRLSVADTGTGMDDATLARAVEPFFSTKGIGKGTGLGLSMVHGLASQMGGALTISSRLGEGSEIELWLPQTDAAPEPMEALPEPPATDIPRGTALLVDDEEFVRLSTADMLSDLGYSVIEASSAEEALRIIRRGDAFDLLVTDHLMPGMSGTDLARTVRDDRPGLPVLLVSGYAEREGIEADLPRITKPFRKDELAAGLALLTPPA